MSTVTLAKITTAFGMRRLVQHPCHPMVKLDIVVYYNLWMIDVEKVEAIGGRKTLRDSGPFGNQPPVELKSYAARSDLVRALSTSRVRKKTKTPCSIVTE